MFWSTKKDNWIAITEDRRPQELFDHILCDIDGNRMEGWRDHNDYYRYTSEGAMVLENITHFMPFPAPPIRK